MRCQSKQQDTSDLDHRLLSALAFGAMLMACTWFAVVSRTSFAAEGEPAKQSAKKDVKQKPFATADEAVQTLAAAVKAGDIAALKSILGPGGEAILESGDPILDRETRERFSAAYEESHKLEQRGVAKTWVLVGKDDWPLPIPLVKRGSSWYFDTKSGKDELLNRRIGRNELSANQAVLAYVDAQREYYLRNPANDKLLHYADKFVSSKGKRDGLYYPTKSDEKPSPLGPLFDARRAAGYLQGEEGKPGPYHGYYYKILKAQGPKAPGGAYDYVANGKMIGGFALVAYPATYANTGVVTYLVNHDGVVYEKNLGPKTTEIAQKITRFDPDESWKRH